MSYKSSSLIVWGLPAVLLAASISAQAGVILDEDGDIAVITDVPVTISGVTTTYEVTYIYGTFEDVFGASDALPSGWPFKSLGTMSAAINAIANALDANGVGDIPFTNKKWDGTTGTSDGAGSTIGLVPFNVGAIAGCDWCVETRGVYYAGSASGWSPDGANTGVKTALTTSAAGYIVGPEVTWAVFYTPTVPEPETYAFLLSGLALVGWAARRRINTRVASIH